MNKIVIILLTLIALIVIAASFIKTCDFIGGWGRGNPKACDCKGIKITTDNSLPVDGNYQTVCVGISSPK
jgi:hypothetical protein